MLCKMKILLANLAQASIKDVEEIELFSGWINLRGAAAAGGMNIQCRICVDEYVEVAPLSHLSKCPARTLPLVNFALFSSFSSFSDKTVHIPLFSSSSIHICTAAYGVTLCSDCTQQELRVREGFWAKYCFCADAGMTGLFRLSPMYQFPSAAVKLVNPVTDLPAATKARVTSHHTQVSLLARNGIFFI